MDIRQIRYFLKIAETRSFTKAAEQLRIAQPALSSGMRKLEEEIGQQLLVRHSRGVDLTPAGEILRAGAAEILEKLNETLLLLREASQVVSGQVNIGVPPGVSLAIATTLVRRAKQRFPKVSINLVENLSPVLLEWVETGRLDMTLAYQGREARGLISEPVFQEDLYFFESARFADPTDEPIGLRDVAELPLAMVSAKDGLIGRIVKEAAKRAGLELNVAFEMHSVPIVAQIVEEGGACSILPLGAVRQLVQDNKLLARKIIDPVISVTLNLAYPANQRETGLYGPMRELIREIMADRRG